MNEKLVKNLMVPLREYAVVSSDATLREALVTLAEAQAQLSHRRPLHRAVLVADQDGEIVGKLGQLGFLEALEPKYKVLGDIEKLSQAGVSEEFINSIMDNYRFWQNDLQDVSRRANTIRIAQVMKVTEASIDENKSLSEAIHTMVMWQAQSVMVTREERVVGILRLSDLFSEVVKFVTSSASK